MNDDVCTCDPGCPCPIHAPKLDRATARVIAEHAHHIREKDRVAKALKVMVRYPLYTLRGADRHHELNGDVFEKESEAAE